MAEDINVAFSSGKHGNVSVKQQFCRLSPALARYNHA
jgi:hypothetical protein